MIKNICRFSEKKNHFRSILKSFQIDSRGYKVFSPYLLNDNRFGNNTQSDHLPFCYRVLLESSLRNCDQFFIKTNDINNILQYQNTIENKIEIPFKPARVILQDFTGVPAVVDFAAMRDAVTKFGKNPNIINPLCPVDLVIDHSVQVDSWGKKDSYKINEEIEFKRNQERFQFLKWGSKAFNNFSIVPPGNGIVHQVNLQYLAKGALCTPENILYPDSLVGTDSHTTMINGLGIVGWGVGGIEAEAVMLGQPITMLLPQTVGFRLEGQLQQNVTATDLVLTITNILRAKGVVGKFIEFYGDGYKSISIADRATIANMSPQYGATIGFFPPDEKTMQYMRQTGRSDHHVRRLQESLTLLGLYEPKAKNEKKYTYNLSLDLSKVQPCMAGPKRPQDRVSLSNMKKDFNFCLTNSLGNKGYGLAKKDLEKKEKLNQNEFLKHGDVVIAAITSCTNTSNPDVMMAAGIVAKNAVEKGLKVKPWIKTSLSPGSGVVTEYLNQSGLYPYLQKLGFSTVGYGCMTCIGNSGDLVNEVQNALHKDEKLIVASVLSGNRNFQARIHQQVKANYLASPPLVVAYALAGTVDIDLTKDPIGKDNEGKEVYLNEIWPTRREIQYLVKKYLKKQMFFRVYNRLSDSNQRWNQLQTTTDLKYHWKQQSTYIHNPPFFKNISLVNKPIENIKHARCLAFFGDSITTDHISPAGKIASDSPAAQYLRSKNIKEIDFNTYGSRRGNDEVMARGTFANTRIINRLIETPGPKTIFFPTNQIKFISEAALLYKQQNIPLLILAGKQYGSGSSRDWAAKGPFLLGVRVILAESYERIHRTNLVGMGILPLQYEKGKSATSYGLTGKEEFNIKMENLRVGGSVSIEVTGGISFEALVRIDTDAQMQYFRNGGILQYVLKNLAQQI